MKLFVSLLLGILLIASQGTWGAEADDAETKADSSPSDSDNKGTDGVFLPSEEISEDFAVSFPVDI